MRFIVFIASLSCLAALSDPSAAADPMACVTAKCEAPGKECVAKAAVLVDSCTKAARKDCNQSELPDKMKCLKDGLGKCATDRHQALNACKDQVKACRGECGAADEKRLDSWCYGEGDGNSYAAFCTGEAGKNPHQQLDACITEHESHIAATGIARWGCDPL